MSQILSRRETVALTLALLLHAVALLCVGRKTHGPIDGVGPEAEPFEVEIESAPTGPSAPEPVEPRLEEARLGSVPAVSTARAPTIERAPSLGGENVSPEVAPSAAASGTFSMPSREAPPLSNEALGLAGRNRFLGTLPGQDGGMSPVDQETRNVAPGVDQSMRDALDARDHDLGLDIAGPLVAVAEELTRPSDTPVNGRAVFEVIVDADGNVLEVRVIDASDNRASWERLGAQLRATLRARRIAWRRKGHALVAQIEVTSRWGLPSGQAAGRVLSGPFATASPESLSAGAHFDVSDIGARPARSVHARILGEKSLSKP